MDIGIFIVIGYLYLIWLLVVIATNRDTLKTEEDNEKQNKLIATYEKMWNWIVKVTDKSISGLFSSIQKVLDLLKIQK